MKPHSLLKRSVSFVTAIIILLSLSLSLFSCQRKAATKEEIAVSIAETVANDTYGHEYVTLYLYDWNLPAFDTKKLSWVEEVFKQSFNLKSGLPATLAHAELTAKHFLENYYDTVDKEDKNTVTDALITSYVYVIGDPYSVYRTPDESDDYSQSLSGFFGGIGVTVEYDHTKKTVMVISVNEDGPAKGAGILAGDYIVGVDGESIDTIGYDRIVDRIRGKVGTDVTVTVKRGDTELSMTMKRATIENKTVTYSIDEEKIGYIRVTGFEQSTTEQFREAVDAMEAAGAVGIVFDMRSNPGGLVNVVTDMMSYILPTGKTVVTYEFKNRPLIDLKTQADAKNEETGEETDHVLNLPMAVVCNEFTASSAEIFTSVIRDYRNDGLLNAVIVGQTTYKKGIMQSSYTYSQDLSSVTLTVAYYNPPSGVNYHGIGITPDVEVSLPELKEGETAVEDTQLKGAIEELKKLINAN